MKLKYRYNLSDFIITVVIWHLSFLLLVFFKFQDLDEDLIKSTYNNPILSKDILYFSSWFLSLVFGFFFGLMHIYVYPRVIKSNSFIKSLLLRLIIFLITFSISYFVVFLFFWSNFFMPVPRGYVFIRNHIWLLLFSAIVINAWVDFFLLIRKNMGPSYFLYLLGGKYVKPKEEKRIFMFLDLASSTSIAEEIGHLKFSRMLQDCFRRLSATLLRFDAEIYQFVGDEAVITWRDDTTFSREKCLMLYFDFMDQLNSNKEEFLFNYGVAPVFRASLHLGKVTMALVGEIKTEIVFHGDVLNTASRIQGLCKKYGEGILVSGAFCLDGTHKGRFGFERIDDVQLEGKRQNVAIFKVLPKDRAFDIKGV